MTNLDKNYLRVKGITETLEAIAQGRLYECPKCGEYVEDNNLFCPCCGEQVDLINDESGWQQVSMWDYFSDALDIEYIIGGDRQYRGVRVTVAFGGPNIYIDTLKGCVDLYWWDKSASYNLTRAVCDEIDEMFEKLYNS